MRKLRIAQIAPLWYKIPPEKYGGTELVVYNLTEELVRRGHKVTLFASGDSRTSAKLASVYPHYLKKDGIEWTDQKYTLLNLAEAFKRQDQFDIIHSHIDLYDLYFAHLLNTPVISTMHNRLMIDKIKVGSVMKDKREDVDRINIYQHFRKHNIITVSKSQIKLSFVKMNFLGTVYNGLDLENYKYNSKGSDYFIWAGRMHRDKGAGNVVRMARKLGIKLRMAGRVKSDSEKKYFKEEIKPFLNDSVRYIGEISTRQKSGFFGNARALLYPIEWDEPFGLVMTEAMACGTPVIAYDRGSVSEIIENGKTGYVAKNISGFSDSIRNIGKINRKTCRLVVEKKFSTKSMAEGYEDIYYKILNSKI